MNNKDFFQGFSNEDELGFSPDEGQAPQMEESPDIELNVHDQKEVNDTQKQANDSAFRIINIPSSNRNSRYSPQHQHSSSPAPSPQRPRRRKRKKIRIGRIIIALVVILAVLGGLIFLGVQLFSKFKDEKDSPDNTTPKNTITTSNEASQPADAVNPKASIDLNAWNLILVNSQNTIDASFTPVTKTLENGREVDERIYEPLLQMITDARAENLYIIPTSTYRTFDYQQGLYDKQIRSVLNTKNVSQQEAEAEAGTVVAVPGTSEHQTGLAVDIITRDYTSLDEGILDTPEVAWMYENCFKYGFIVRYPKEMKNVTGIIYEPWHYRYVGVEAATEIMSRNITLEQYIEEIKEAQAGVPVGNSVSDIS